MKRKRVPPRADKRKRGREALPPMSEDEWQAQVLELAGTLGWKSYHPYDSRRSREGYPDLTLVSARKRRVVWIELKVPPYTTTPAQEEWLAELRGAGQEAYVLYPDQFEDLKEILMREGT